MRLTRDAVLDAAMTLVDRYGLGDLTMRRLAADLGVQPGALYWHVPSKQALLAALADRIVAGVSRPESGNWRSDLGQLAGNFCDVMLDCRDGAEVVTAGLALRPGSTEPLDTMIEILNDAGFEAAIARAAGTALQHQVIGHVTARQSHDQLRAAAAVGAGPGHAAQLAADFTIGLDIFLDGLACRVS